MKVFSVLEGRSPIILAQPHGGTHVPDSIRDQLNDTGKALADTDWHINRLYDGLLNDVTVVQSHVHRYVIDANRDPEDVSLYPGQNTTSLCPLTDFDGNPIYKTGREPSEDEIKQRCNTYHRPYHNALADQIERLKQIHGSVILYDCHSIRSTIPFLFDGTLPDFNIGTFNGHSCNPEIEAIVKSICSQVSDYTYVVNGRFKGGWTTRHYGQPDQNIHAIQMELAQSTYMLETAPWHYVPTKAKQTRRHLKIILKKLCCLANSLNGKGREKRLYQ